MKIEKFPLLRLRNEEHFQFDTDFKTLVVQATPVALGVEALFASWLAGYAQESEAIEVIRKSSITDEIFAADERRDRIFRGFCLTVEAVTYHYNPVWVQAALRLKTVTDHYGNLTVMSYLEETASIANFISELNGARAADIATINAGVWLSELENSNTAFSNLMSSRFTESAGKPQLNIKQVRSASDTAYNRIIDFVNIMVVMNGEAAYAGFINELNKRVEYYRTLLNKRKPGDDKDAPVPPAAIPQ